MTRWVTLRSGGNRSFLERQGRSESKGKAAALCGYEACRNPSRDAIWLLEVLVVPVDVLSFSLQQDAWPKRVRGSPDQPRPSCPIRPL